MTADKVLMAPGGHPESLGVPGDNYCINSDDFFSLEEQPRRIAIIGAGYIAVELAGVLNLLGTETHLFIRGTTPLRQFDEMLQSALQHEMITQGVRVHSSARQLRYEGCGIQQFVGG